MRYPLETVNLKTRAPLIGPDLPVALIPDIAAVMEAAVIGRNEFQSLITYLLDYGEILRPSHGRRCIPLRSRESINWASARM